MKLFVGNLSYETTEEELQDIFSQHGTVVSAKVITDRYTDQSKGFAFVEMSSREEGTAAQKALDGSELGGRNIIVNEARPQEERRSGPGGSGNGNNRRPRHNTRR